jgi:hypothetical protein
LARAKTPEYSQEALDAALVEYINKVGTGIAFDYGVYNGLPLGNAVRGRGFSDTSKHNPTELQHMCLNEDVLRCSTS